MIRPRVHPHPNVVLVYPYTEWMHHLHTRSREALCAVEATCRHRPSFTLIGDRYNVASCTEHLPVAVRLAHAGKRTPVPQRSAP